MKKYLQYAAIDFAQEPSFILWVTKQQTTEDFDWDGWIESNSEKSDDINKAISLVQGMKFESMPIDNRTQQRVWEAIDGQTASGKSTVGRRSILRWLGTAAAAAAIATVIFVNTGDTYDTSIKTAVAEMTEHTLPDGSLVTLNASSRLRFNKESWAKTRELYLEGEAFFDVEKGSQFTVHTEVGTVLVLGTSFNVLTRNKTLEVICQTGKVQVSCQRNKTTLTPSQSVTVVEGVHTVRGIVAKEDSRSNWMKGIYVYDDSPLVDVLKELERQFSTSIQTQEQLGDLSYTGRFTTANLETALESVLWPTNLTYSIDGDTVTVAR